VGELQRQCFEEPDGFPLQLSGCTVPGTSDRWPVYGVKGVTSPVNRIGGRNVPGIVVDASGDVIVFGGTGFNPSGSTSYLADFWRQNGDDHWGWACFGVPSWSFSC